MMTLLEDNLHFDFEKGIRSILEITPLNIISNNLKIDFHIDSISLYIASHVQLYSMIRIANIHQSKSEFVGIWKRFSKSTNATELLKSIICRLFVDVLKMKSNNGIIFNEKKLIFDLRCFIADAVAQAFIRTSKSDIKVGRKSRIPCSKC